VLLPKLQQLLVRLKSLVPLLLCYQLLKIATYCYAQPRVCHYASLAPDKLSTIVKYSLCEHTHSLIVSIVVMWLRYTPELFHTIVRDTLAVHVWRVFTQAICC